MVYGLELNKLRREFWEELSEISSSWDVRWCSGERLAIFRKLLPCLASVLGVNNLAGAFLRGGTVFFSEGGVKSRSYNAG
ncbi:unnamed protein product [Camellia sinensis]